MTAAPPQTADPGLSRDYLAPFGVDVALTLSPYRHGGGDPAYRTDPAGAVWRTSLTPDGPGTLRVQACRAAPSPAAPSPAAPSPAAPSPAAPSPAAPSPAAPASAGSAPAGLGPAAFGTAGPGPARPATAGPASASGPCADPDPGLGRSEVGGPVVTAQAWGPGARWLLDTLPALLGFHDDRASFAVRHPVIGELALRYQGLRVGRGGRVFEALVPAVLEQKVVGREAHRAWRFLLLRYGSPAPGPAPAGMRVIPPPLTWARIPSWDWHRAGVEGVRARTIVAAAAVAARLEETLDLEPAEADRRLRSLPGIGPWTSAETRQRAMGDPDAVSVGDYHLPNVVGWTLARRKTDDAGMLELLAPYAGHRYRVTRLIELGGSGPPRRGPRMPVRDYRAL